MKRGTWVNSLVLIPLLIAAASGQDGGGRLRFPEAKPEHVGMDEAKLVEARDYALRGGGSGCVLRGGRLVMSWGDQHCRYDIYSSTKSIGVTALGLAIMDGKVNLHDPAKRFLSGVGVPPETNAQSGWLEELTLWHLATQTGGFEKTQGWCRQLKRPGTTWMYSDGGPNWLADCLTVAYGRDLLTVVNERVFQPLGITVGPGKRSHLPGATGGQLAHYLGGRRSTTPSSGRERNSRTWNISKVGARAPTCRPSG